MYGFGAMFFLGFMFAAWTAARRGLSSAIRRNDVGHRIWLFIAGVIGCRIFYCIQYTPRMFFNVEHGAYVLKSLPDMLLSGVNLPDGGLVCYGGLFRGADRRSLDLPAAGKLNFLELGDVLIPSLFLGIAFGRIGCFLNGCCYGDRCSLPWGVTFPMGSVPDMALVAPRISGHGPGLLAAAASDADFTAR